MAKPDSEFNCHYQPPTKIFKHKISINTKKRGQNAKDTSKKRFE